MNNDHTSVKLIVSAIEDYYSGRKVTDICEDHEITEIVFNNWLAKYKHVAFEIMELKLENERLRNMFINVSLKHHNQIDNPGVEKDNRTQLSDQSDED